MMFSSAIAVSGGPDSMALCVLTAAWKTETRDAAIDKRSKSIDGLLAIVVDHGLRTESTDEAKLVYNRITDMGTYICYFCWVVWTKFHLESLTDFTGC